MKRILTLLIFSALLLSGCSKARIITAQDEVHDGDWLCFRKEFNLFSSDASLRIAADTKYWLYVNGELVVREGGLKRGPNPDDSYIDTFDRVPNLRFGKNQVTVLVQYYERTSFSHRASATPGLYFELKSALRRVVSDSSWKAFSPEALYAPPQEFAGNFKFYRSAGANFGIDNRKDLSFTEENYDDSQKADAIEVSREDSGWGEFAERPIPQWRWSEIRPYVKTEREGNRVICSLPYNLQSHPYIKFRSIAGDTIDIRTDDYHIGQYTQFRGECIARDGEQEFEMPCWINGHKVIYTVPEGTEVLDLGYRESGYDADIRGSFECSDPFLNTLWRKAARTLYVGIRDTYMDCPDRERAQWWFDAVISLQIGEYVFGPELNPLTRKAIHELIDWRGEDGALHSPIPGFYDLELPCQMLSAVGRDGFWRYFMHSDDRETMEYVYDAVKRYLLKVWEPQPQGLVKVRRGGWFWGDWGDNIDKDALQQCWYYMAVEGLENMAKLLGRKTDALYFSQMRHRERLEFNLRYWNGKYYVSKDYSQEPDDRVQAMAVVSGLAPEENYPAITSFLHEHFNASPAMEKYVSEALCLMGAHEYAVERIKERYKDMVESSYTTLWEGWGYTGSEGSAYRTGHGSYNHPWSGGGATVMSQYLAGIAPSEPEYRRFTVKPCLAGLDWISAKVPTKYGDIDLRIETKTNGAAISITVPENTSATLFTPAGFSSLVDGQDLKPQIELGPGAYSILAVR